MHALPLSLPYLLFRILFNLNMMASMWCTIVIATRKGEYLGSHGNEEVSVTDPTVRLSHYQYTSALVALIAYQWTQIIK